MKRRKLRQDVAELAKARGILQIEPVRTELDRIEISVACSDGSCHSLPPQPAAQPASA